MTDPYQYAIPLLGCQIGDLVVADHCHNGKDEWVGRVAHMTKTTVTVNDLKETMVSEYATGSDAADVRVLADPVEDAGSSYVFRWAKVMGRYQTSGTQGTQYRLVRHYKPGDKLVFQAYY